MDENSKKLYELLVEHAERKMLQEAPVQYCRWVLWFFGDREYGQEPGDFCQKLFEAAAAADPYNGMALAKAFPIVTLWKYAQSAPEGLNRVRDKVAAFELIETVRFGMDQEPDDA
jgi:hypothetical protein